MSEQLLSYEYRFLTDGNRVKGSLSRFREGAITLNQNGFSISGKAVLPMGYQILIALGGASLMGVGLMLSAILLEYVIRVQHAEFYFWENLDDVVIEHQKRRICLVFHEPGNPKKVTGLTLQLPQDKLEHFISVIDYFLPGKTREGKIQSFSIARVGLGCLGVFIVVFLLCILLLPHSN
jgi:hypothetical protein